MKKILITGSTGLLGSALHFKAPKEFKVAGTVRKNRQMPNIKGVHFYALDITDHDSVQQAVLDFKPDVIIHTAAQANVDYCETHKEEAWDVNVEGSRNIMAAAAKVGAQVIFCSTNSIYDGKNPPYSDKDMGNPVDYYGETKVKIETELRSSGQPYLIVRLMTMLGWNNPYERLNPITWLLPKLKNGEDIFMTTDMFNNFLANWSGAESIWEMIKQGRTNETFNIAGKDKHNRFELATTAAKVFGYSDKKIKAVTSDFFKSLTPRPPDTSFDVSKMEDDLKVKPLLLEEIFKYMKKNQPKDNWWKQLDLDLTSLNKKVVIMTHCVMYENGEIHGPAHAVSKFLKSKGVEHWFIRHPLTGNWPTKIDLVGKDKNKSSEVKLSRLPLISYIHEMIWNMQFISKQKNAVIIGVDPLNTIAAVLVRPFTKVSKIVYFSADFALARFSNPIMNTIYRSFDFISSRSANFCWSVSSRIVDFRLKQGVERGKNLHIPNAPAFDSVPRKEVSKINKFDLVIVSNLEAWIEFKMLFEVIRDLSKTKFPKLNLKIIGGGSGEEEMKSAVSKLKITDRVEFLGRQPHEKVHEILSNCGIGIAIYNDTAPWRWFSDSMKARDYMAAGLPVIISGDTSTTTDIEENNAGKAVELNKKALENALIDLLSNEGAYKTARENAIRLAKMNDINQVLTYAFSRLIG